ncbi:hypothetical protein BD410DRAFT_899974 [Rickenella mellea]|uniref:Methyltransferase domain-containing protein n=1 Tax=Rickenella mellea TaxID=50990 RepID=A0A4Y7PYZ0_9AGAM|nr:hypothetical protein BD410DRAFT_899974 [Rickenella mellea]
MVPAIFQRQPRYVWFTALVVLATIFLLALSHSPFRPPFYFSPRTDGELQALIAQSELVYKQLLLQRKDFITKFGPTPDKISMFPRMQEYTVWDFFPAAFNCPHEISRIGRLGEGGKWVCGLSRIQDKQDCVVYSFGISHESSFEAEILSRTKGCKIYGYDFTVDGFGPEITSGVKDRTHFEKWGVAGVDAHGKNDETKMYTLLSLMALNGHKYIDILKMDVEGAEFDALGTVFKEFIDANEPLPFGQLQLEIHTGSKHFEWYLGWWETLERAGLRPFWTEPNLVFLNYLEHVPPELAEYSFLNIRGENDLISSTHRSTRNSMGWEAIRV